jgi:galactokinase
MLIPAIPLTDLAAAAAEGLRAAFGRYAAMTAAAPGRVNLIGEHIDYCEGFVMPLAIDRTVVIAAAANDRGEARIGTAADEPVTIPLGHPAEPGLPTWANYVRGVIRGFQDRGLVIPGFDAWIVSSVPMGAGLSSSAALECAAATLLEGLVGTQLGQREKALLCQKAEHDFTGVPCGIMDQFASTFGETDRLVLVDCRSREPLLVPFSNPDLTVVIANTNVRHELTDGGYASRKRDTDAGLEVIGKASWREVTMADVEAAWDRLGDPVNRRCRHVVGEIARTVSAARTLEANDLESLGPLMAASHDSLRDDFEVSCRELDIMVEIARRIGRGGGVIGARMTGGGFGGSIVTLCDSSRAEEIAGRLHHDYLAATSITPEIFASRPTAGGRLL